MLTDAEVAKIKDELVTSKHPFFIFDDDPDGLCSFLLLYRFLKEGKGMVLKARPLVTENIVAKVQEYGADKTFILDLANVEQGFLDNVGTPVVWIDHHALQEEQKGVLYFNPKKNDKACPTTFMAYQVVKEDLWLAAAGCVGDWFLPDFLEEVKEKYPGLITREYKSPPDILYHTPLGTLIRALSFNLKGSVREAMKSVKILTRIEHPDEILKQTTPQGKFIWKRYEEVNKKYQAVKEQALKDGKSDGHLFVFTYSSDDMSVTSDLSNELMTLFPEKVVILARDKSGQMKCSLRSSGPKNVQKALEKALIGINGYGGGHMYACGANVPAEEFSLFLEQLNAELDIQ